MGKKIAIDLKKVEEYAKQGMSENQIADALGVSRSTVQRRRKDCEAFESAYKKGRGRGVAHVTSKLWEAVNQLKPWAIMFYLERIAGFVAKPAEPERPEGSDTLSITIKGI